MIRTSYNLRNGVPEVQPELDRMEGEGGTAYIQQRYEMAARRWRIRHRRLVEADTAFLMVDVDWRALNDMPPNPRLRPAG